MIQALVRSHFYLYAGHVQTIDVPGVPLACHIPVLVWFVDQANRYPTVNGSYSRIGVPLIRYAIHDNVDLLSLLIKVELSPIEEIFTIVKARREVKVGADWEGRVFTTQCSCDIGIIAIENRVCPQVVVLRFKTLNKNWIVREINCLVDVVYIWRLCHKEIG